MSYPSQDHQAWTTAPPYSQALSHSPYDDPHQVNKQHEQPYSLDPMLLMGGAGAPGQLEHDEPQVHLQGHDFAPHPQTGDEGLGAAQLSYSQDAYAAPHLTFTSSTSSIVPELSPPATATPSSSGSSYSGFVSSQAPPADPQTTPPNSSRQTFLLPSADIVESSTGAGHPGQATSAVSGFQQQEPRSHFGELQESFLQQNPSPQQTLVAPSTPTKYLPSPHARHRSPAPTSSSVPNSPVSPYARPLTPGYQPYLQRRGSTASLPPDSPSRRGRRQSRLSIAVPPHNQAQPPPSPSYAVTNQLNALSMSAGPGQGQQPIAAEDMPVLPASQEDMDKLMKEIGTILGPEVMASLDTSPEVSRRQRSVTDGGSGYPDPIPIQGGQYAQGMVEMNGMTLSEEDFALVQGELDQRAYPSSAPAWQTSFPQGIQSFPHPQQHSPQQYHRPAPYPPSSPSRARTQSAQDGYAYPPSPHGSPQRALSLSQSHSSYLGPPTSPIRPRSAQAYAKPYGNHGPLHPSPLGHRRRRSSLESGLLNYPPVYPSVMAEPGFPLPPSTPTHSHYTLPNPEQAYYSPSPSSRHQLPYPESPTRAPKSPTKQAAARRRTQSGNGGAKEKANIFINFTSNDSKKLLSGVAPSGSKRKRDEEDLAKEKEKEKAAAEVAGIAPAAAVATTAA